MALALGTLWLLPVAAVVGLSGLSAAAESGALRIGGTSVLWRPSDPGEGLGTALNRDYSAPYDTSVAPSHRLFEDCH